MSGNLLACFILTSGPITLALWPGIGVGKKVFYILAASQTDRRAARDSFSGSHPTEAAFFARRRFVYSDVFTGASRKPLSCIVRRRYMNIQCGEKKERGNRFKCCASGAGCRQSRSPTRFSFVITVVQNSSTPRAYCPSFCLCSCAGWRGESSAHECKCSAPWLLGMERTGSRIVRRKTEGGGERNDGWITR